jgi:hypothetical protein
MAGRRGNRKGRREVLPQTPHVAPKLRSKREEGGKEGSEGEGREGRRE